MWNKEVAEILANQLETELKDFEVEVDVERCINGEYKITII